jgi:hypothetical protein
VQWRKKIVQLSLGDSVKHYMGWWWGKTRQAFTNSLLKL